MESITKSEPSKGKSADAPYKVTNDVAGIKTLFVNLFFVGEPGPGNPWVLVDTGFMGFSSSIKDKAAELFGEGTKPQAIVLTHGHADHVGNLESLLKDWDVPVYAHRLELPYIQGKSSYPPPDPAIGGGGMAYMSWIFPIGPTDFGDRIKAVEDGDTIPELPGWKVVFTPGHAPGHISLFRESDRTLLSGDAFVTTNQNEMSAVATQRKEFHGPPAYFTCDWDAARQSVKKLKELKPLAVGTGHGVVVSGSDLTIGLNKLTDKFDELSIPSKDGRYVKQAAVTDEFGIVSMPTPISFHVARTVGVGVVLGILLYSFWPRRDDD